MANGTIWGSFSGTSPSNVRPYIQWSSTPNSSTNQSSVTATLVFVKYNASWGSFNDSFSNTSSINGSTHTQNNSFDLRPVGTAPIYCTVRSRTVTVSHNADGTKSCVIGWSGDTRTSLGTFNFSATVTLDTITRAGAVSTSAASSVGGTSATVGGNVTDAGIPAVTRGIHWGTSSSSLPNWIESGSGWGTYSVNITGLSRGTTYYFRAGAYNSSGWVYGSVLSFTTTAAAPSVTTSTPSNISHDSATLGGNVTNDNGASVTERGVCYSSTSTTPTTSDTKDPNGSGTGEFSEVITGLSPDTTYYVRAYAINSQGTSYGAVASFTTISAEPTVTTTSGATGVTISSATVAGNVVSDNGATITERGFVYSKTDTVPTILNSKATVPGTTGAMSKEITGLSIGTKYYFRAFATNERGTGYGDVYDFTTLPGNPSNLVATTVDKDKVSLTWVKGNGGNYTIVRRGTTPPANINSGTLIYQGTGTSFTDTGLEHGTTYYYRAWAATTEDWSEAYSSSYSASSTTTIYDFTDPTNAYADDTNCATVLANDAKLYAQVSRDGGNTWSLAKELTIDTLATQSFGMGETEEWGMTAWNGGHMNDTNFRVRLIGGSNGVSYQIYKNFGFSINSSYTLTGVQVQIKAAWDGSDILLYFIKVNAYYGTSPLPVKAGSLAYDNTLNKPVFYNGERWLSLEDERSTLDLLDWFYPVGTIYKTTSPDLDTPAKMNAHFGGTWEEYGEGEFLVGKSSDTEFDTVGKTGGEKTHTLTTAEMPTHTHTQNSHNHTQNAHNHGQNPHNHGIRYKAGGGSGYATVEDGGPWDPQTYHTSYIQSVTATNQATTATNQATTATNQNAGGGQAHNNLPPYRVVYVYRRIS